MKRRSDKEAMTFVDYVRQPVNRARMKKAWREGLKATKTDRITGAEVPDVKTRKEFFALGVAYSEGLPVQRQEVHSVQWSGLKEIRARLKERGWLMDSGDGRLTLKNRADDLPSEEVAIVLGAAIKRCRTAPSQSNSARLRGRVYDAQSPLT